MLSMLSLTVCKAELDAAFTVTLAALSLGEVIDFGLLCSVHIFAGNTRPQMGCRIDSQPFANQAVL